ncbi:MAG TPA: tetratricopeptide repeat protein [Polyangia bacterium]
MSSSSPPSVPAPADLPPGADDGLERAEPWARLALVALVFVVFGGALRFGFVYDDRWTLLDNPVIRELSAAWSLLGRGHARSGVPDAGRPLLLLSEMADWAIGNARPLGFHLQNLLWHAAAALLVQRALRAWGHSAGVSLATAAVFAVHPLVVEPVVVINYREDLMAVSLVLAALVLAAPRPSGERLRRWGAALAIALAAFAKESALVAPLLWAAFLTMSPTRARADRPAGHGKAGASFAVPVLLVFAWRWWAHGAGAVVSLTADIPAAHTRMIFTLPRGFFNFAHGFSQFLVPVGLAPEYPDLPDSARIWGWVAGAIILGVSVWAWRLRRRMPGVGLGWAIAVIGYLPNVGLVPLTNLRADRYFYMPLVGWSLLVVSLIAALASRLSARAGLATPDTTTKTAKRSAGSVAPVLCGLVAVALLVLGVRARQHARIYRNDVSLFSAAVASDPRSQRAQIGLALALLRNGQRLAAAEAAERALALSPSPRALEAAGIVALAAGDLVTAHERLSRALDGSEGQHRAQVLFNLGLAEQRLRKLEAAEAHWQNAMTLAPGFDRPAVALAQAAWDRGDTTRAREVLESVVTRVPGSVSAWQTLARLHAHEGRREEAARAHERARRLGGDGQDPGFAP